MSLAFTPDGRRLASASDDTTVLLWDMALPPAAAARRVLAPDEVRKRWEELAGADAARAYDAMVTLAASPAEATALLKRELKPAAADADAAKVDRLIADLDGERFATREQPERDVRTLGTKAEPALRRALEGRPSAEARKRLEGLLARLEAAPSPEQLREVRAVELLERLGTPEARALLRGLAGGTPDTRLTREAQAALRR